MTFSPVTGDRPDVPNIAIVITDSESTASPQHLLREAEATRAAGITVFAIGVGSNINLVGNIEDV